MNNTGWAIFGIIGLISFCAGLYTLSLTETTEEIRNISPSISLIIAGVFLMGMTVVALSKDRRENVPMQDEGRKHIHDAKRALAKGI